MESSTNSDGTTDSTGASSARLLIVDDNPQILRFASCALMDAGFSIMTASSADEAIALIQQNDSPIDLLLVDVVMPKLSGHHLANQLLERHPDAHVLLMSGYPKLSSFLNGLETRSEPTRVKADFIQKPFTVRALTEKVRTVLSSRKSSSI